MAQGPQYDLQPLLDTKQNHLSLIFSDSSSIDAKALAVLAADIAILIFIAQSDLHLAPAGFILLLGPFILALLLNGAAIWPRKYIGASINLDKHPDYLSMEKDALLLQLLADTQLAIDKNSAINQTRWSFCAGSIVLSLIGLVLLFVKI
jgi:hypothetical protein